MTLEFSGYGRFASGSRRPDTLKRLRGFLGHAKASLIRLQAFDRHGSNLVGITGQHQGIAG